MLRLPAQRAFIKTNRNLFKPQRIHKRTYISPGEVVDFLTTSLQSIHAATSIPWWALIPLSTIAFRTVWTLPFAILQRKRLQKQSNLRPIVSAMGPILRLKLASNAQKRQQEALQQAEKSPQYKQFESTRSSATSLSFEQIMLLSIKEQRKRQKQLFKDNNCQLYKNFLLPAFQIPLWIAMSFSIRNLTGWKGWSDINSTSTILDKSLYTEGTLWFQDLSLADPYGVLPIMVGTFSLINIEYNNRILQLQNEFKSKKSLRPTVMDSIVTISRIAIVFLMTVATQAPAAISLYWISSNGFSMAQNMILDYFIPIRYIPKTRAFKLAKNEERIPLFTRN